MRTTPADEGTTGPKCALHTISMSFVLGTPFGIRAKVAVLAIAVLALTASAAMAAGTFDKSSVAANSDVAVTLKVSVEQLGAYDDHVVLEIPNGFRVLACPKTNDFNCTPSTAEKPT